MKRYKLEIEKSAFKCMVYFRSFVANIFFDDGQNVYLHSGETGQTRHKRAISALLKSGRLVHSESQDKVNKELEDAGFVCFIDQYGTHWVSSKKRCNRKERELGFFDYSVRFSLFDSGNFSKSWVYGGVSNE